MALNNWTNIEYYKSGNIILYNKFPYCNIKRLIFCINFNRLKKPHNHKDQGGVKTFVNETWK